MKMLMMFYNVENFFQPEQEKCGLYNWTPYKYQLKVRKINLVFNFINENFRQVPGLIGLAEIGDISVINDLQAQDSLIQNHQVVYQKSNDKRGLSCALLYDAHQLELINSDFLRFNIDASQAFETRDIIHATFLHDNKKLNVFVVHLPSQRLQDEKRKQRNHILEQLRIKINHIINDREAVILMGDFNENPNAKSIQNLKFDEHHNQILENPFEAFFHQNQFTSFHGKTGVCFDQFLYSTELLKSNFGFNRINSNIFSSPKLRNKDSKNQKFPIRTYSGSRYMGGYSDHFPILLELEK